MRRRGPAANTVADDGQAHGVGTAVLAAKRLGAERIIALSRNPARQAVAREFGATDIVADRGDAAIDAVRDMTHGLGVEAALECVGTGESMATAFAIARSGGMVGAVGAPHDVEVPIDTVIFRNVGLRGGVAPARRYIPELLPDVLAGRINPGRVAQEVAPFGIGLTIVEPGGARTEFRYGSARVATPIPAYDGNPAHAFQRMLDPANGLAPGDPARMAARIIESVDVEPAPLRLVLGSQALQSTIDAPRQRLEGFEAQRELAASTDFPAGE